MRILLVRHGPAVDPYAAPTDETRWLTDEGRRRVRLVARALADAGLRFTRIYTSPLVRTVQTAELLAAAQPGFDGPIEVHRPLAPEHGSTAQALAPLDRAGEDDVLALVTHEPKVRILAGHLTGLASFPAFRTAAACLVVHDGTRGRFEWMMDPESGELARTVEAVRT
jgi:phosphohistidine phosphatase